MRKRICSVVAIIFFFLIVPFPGYAFLDMFFGENVTVKVVDENNRPIENANVRVIFSNAHAKPHGQGWGDDANYNKVKGLTDADGLFSAKSSTNMDIPVSAGKEGYYESSGGISFNSSGEPDKEIVHLILKKKRNPSPMFAKHVYGVKIPEYEKPVGYDLEIGDWVAPYGKGKVNDFVFTFKSRVIDWRDYNCSYTLTFSNEKDGIQEYNQDKSNQSVYRWPFEAPLDNYKNTFSKYILRVPGKTDETDFKENENSRYIFRIRTITDKDGNIISANYGKINGEITTSREGHLSLSNYYFNPDGSRNLEFDTEKNLFIPEGAEKWKSEYQNYTGFEP